MEGSTEDCENDCEDDCNEKPSLPICKCVRIAEHASRFTLRLLEALRGLKFEGEPGELVSSSTVEEIVRFFEQNYRDVGDLHSQVQTGLRQICSQGLAMELFQHEYYFVGPHANSMNTNARNTFEKPTQCLACSSSKSLQDCTPVNCKNQESATVDNETECKRRARNASRNEGGTKSANNSSSGCSDCNAKAGCRNVDNSTVEHREAEKNVSSNAQSHKAQRTKNQSRKSKSANRQSNSGKRKRNSCRGRRSNASGRRYSASNGQATKDLDDDDSNEDVLSEDTDEIYEATRNQGSSQRSKTRERELKSWIKRCRKKCQDRSTH